MSEKINFKRLLLAAQMESEKKEMFRKNHPIAKEKFEYLSIDDKLNLIHTQQEEILALLKEKKRKGYVVPGLVGRNAYR